MQAQRVEQSKQCLTHCKPIVCEHSSSLVLLIQAVFGHNHVLHIIDG